MLLRGLGHPGVGRVGSALALALVASGWSTVARAAPVVAGLTGGATSGFSADGGPLGIARGPDGLMWFTQVNNPGRVARIAAGVSEYTGGVTTGFSANTLPIRIAAGPDGKMYFTQAGGAGAGGVGRIDPFDTGAPVVQFVGGTTPGLTANAFPVGITAAADGNVWFVELNNPGRLARITPAGQVTELAGGVVPGFTANGAPVAITSAPDGALWFLEQANPGRVARFDPTAATPTAVELTGGVTPGFSANSTPNEITAGPDGRIWFTQFADPGRVARVNPDGTVTELTGGVTPGFSSNSGPVGIAAGPDGRIWFTETKDPGRVARVNDDGTVTEFTGGVTPGFPANSGPQMASPGLDGRLWFTATRNPGRILRITVGPRTITGTATNVGERSATLNGSVDPNGLVTVFHFEYGKTTAYGSQTTIVGAGSGVGASVVSAQLADLTPSTTYHYRVTATNDADTTVGADATFSTQAPATTSPQAVPETQVAPAPVVPSPTTATPALAVLSKLRIAPASFSAAAAGPSARPARRSGALVSFTLDRAARVRFRVERRVTGRRTGTRCVAITGANRRRTRCTRSATMTASFMRDEPAGARRFRFTGRLQGRALRPGNYRLVVTPTSGIRQGIARRAAFHIN